MASGVLLVERYGLNAKAWEIADRAIDPKEFTEISLILLIFLSFSHLVNWYSDYVGYTRWFQSAKLPADSIDAIGSFEKSWTTVIEGLQQRLRRLNELSQRIQAESKKLSSLESDADGMCQESASVVAGIRSEIDGLQKDVSEAKSQFGELRYLLGDIGGNFRRVSIVSGFVIFVWYLALPLLVSGVAAVVILR